MAQPNLSGRQPEKRPCAVTVIIPTYSQGNLLQLCLQHLGSQTFQSFEILVVYNGAQDTGPHAPPATGNLKSIQLSRNEGTAVALNRGLAECRDSPYVFLLNDDTEVEPECLAVLVKALEDDPTCSAAVPKLLQWSDPSLFDGAGDEVLLGGGAYRVGRGQVDEGQFDRRERVLGACAAAALYRRSLFDDIGNFDEDYFAYLEDVDLSLRSLLRGHRFLLVPEARVRHRGSATFGSSFHPEIIRLTTRNRILTVIKNYPLPVLLRVLPRMIIFQILWMGFAIRKRAFGTWCRGLLGAIPLLRKTMGKRRRTMRMKTISNHEMLQKLSESEKRIWRWHSGIWSGRPSRLLAAYFRIFGPPPHVEVLEPAGDRHAPGNMGT